MTPPTDATATGLKEAIARLVDHSAWRWHDKWLDEAETETMRGRAASLRKDAKGHVARSLATADAILALLPSASVGGEREDTVAFVQDWLMNTDYEPTQFDKGFAAAIDARVRAGIEAAAKMCDDLASTAAALQATLELHGCDAPIKSAQRETASTLAAAIRALAAPETPPTGNAPTPPTLSEDLREGVVAWLYERKGCDPVVEKDAHRWTSANGWTETPLCRAALARAQGQAS